MSNHNKPGGKSGQRGRKPAQGMSPKADQSSSQKPDQQLSEKPVQLESQTPLQPESPNPIQPPSPAPVQPQSQNPVEPLNPTPVQPQSEMPVPQQPDGNRPIAAAAASARSPSIGFQAIATAYSDYTRKSFEETRAFVEKLSGVRSLDKAIEIQTEYAKQACQTFVAESERIRELHRELAKQILKPLESFVAKPTRDLR
jgi:phasin family protein